MDKPKTVIVWRPQSKPQKALIDCPFPEVFFGGARGGGKCLPLTEPVLTPFGWRALGDIEEGSQVCSPDGSVSRVIATYRPGSAQTYRLRFSDGAEAVCDDGHIWLGSFVGGKIKRGLDCKLWRFSEIRRRFEENKDSRFLIPLTQPVTFTRPRYTKHGDSRPVDPYLLGLLLGDGCLTGDSVRYATDDAEIDAYCAAFGTVRVDDGPNRRIVHCPDLIAGLRDLGVWGKRAEEKSIPQSYLWADTESRWAILQGLMDTDGTADARGQCYFASSSKELAEGVQCLARSLGFKATIWRKETTHLDSWSVYIRGPQRERLFRLPRKVARATLPCQPHHNVRRLVSIEVESVQEVGCFQVDNPNGLFITRDFVVTHNTDGVLGKWALKEQMFGAAFNAIMFRKTTVSSTDAIERSKEIFGPLGGKFNESKLQWRMPNGGRVGFDYLDSIADADKQQGKNLTDAWIEEAGQFGDPAPIDRIYGALRSARGVPVQMIITANPGGAGQHWIASRYGLIPFPKSPKVVTRQLPNGATHKMAVIPSRITDNVVLLNSDPDYINRLHLVGSEALVRAWLDGDWSAIEGAFFDRWSPKNIVSPFAIPSDWVRFRSGDWGFARPFSIGWWAIAGDEVRGIPRGAIVRYREWYGCNGNPNVGVRLTAEEVASGIAQREAGERISYGVLDPAAFAQNDGPSIAERMSLRGVHWREADNKRVGRNGALGGWDIMRHRIAGENGTPMLYVFDTCRDFIRTIPTLQHDPMRAEDLDTEAEDHVADECFVAGTIVETLRGPCPIERLPESGYVVTDVGLHKYEKPRRTRCNAELVRLTFDNGVVVECTPNHAFMLGSPDEWEYAESLEGKEISCAPLSLVKLCRSSTASVIISAALTFSERALGCIGRYGKRQTAMFLKASTSITSMAIRQITLSTTWNAYPHPSTSEKDTAKQSALTGVEQFDTLSKAPASGMVLKPEGNGTASITSGICGPSWSAAFLLGAKSVARSILSLLRTPNMGSSATRTAKRVRCVSVKRLQKRADVFCLSVPGVERFAIEGGLIVHNCRYACMSRPWVPNPKTEAQNNSSGYRSTPPQSKSSALTL